MKYKLGELFSGPGGIAVGALASKIAFQGEDVGFEHAWASDYHGDTCTTYTNNICPDAPETVYCEDVRKLDISKLGDIDGFAFGFPCNDYSTVGHRHGIRGEFGPLYSYGVEVLDRFLPDFFMAENVVGLSREHTNTLNQILKELTEAGPRYNLTPHIYKAEEYGVPQCRHRLIIVGINVHLEKEFKVPSPIITDERNYRTARQALEEPPIGNDAPNHEKRMAKGLGKERLKQILPGQGIRSASLTSEVKPSGDFRDRNYKRFHPERPASTVITASSTSQGFHWEELRGFTNREAARFQTFEDDFVFTGSWASARRQIGMAVPPLLAKHIFTAILKTLHDIPYPWVNANENWRLCGQGELAF